MTRKLKGSLNLASSSEPADNNTIFRDVADNLLKYKDNSGTVSPLASGSEVKKVNQLTVTPKNIQFPGNIFAKTGFSGSSLTTKNINLSSAPMPDYDEVVGRLTFSADVDFPTQTDNFRFEYYLYDEIDEFDDSSFDTALWTNVPTGGTVNNLVENTEYLTFYAKGVANQTSSGTNVVYGNNGLADGVYVYAFSGSNYNGYATNSATSTDFQMRDSGGTPVTLVSTNGGGQHGTSWMSGTGIIKKSASGIDWELTVVNDDQTVSFFSGNVAASFDRPMWTVHGDSSSANSTYIRHGTLYLYNFRKWNADEASLTESRVSNTYTLSGTLAASKICAIQGLRIRTGR